MGFPDKFSPKGTFLSPVPLTLSSNPPGRVDHDVYRDPAKHSTTLDSTLDQRVSQIGLGTAGLGWD